MTAQEIQGALSTLPFEPFRIMVADGRTFDVRHPEHLAHSGKGRLISSWMEDDSFVILDLLLVTGLQRPIPKRQTRAKRSV